jgi:hypothetical protein
MPGSTLNTLDQLESLCGKDNRKNVIFITTMWDQVLEDIGVAREKELRQKFFRPLCEKGALMFAFDGEAESGWNIIDRLVDDRFAALLRDEAADLKKELCETDTGCQLYRVVEKLVAQHRLIAELSQKDLDGIEKDEMLSSDSLEELRTKYERLRCRLASALEDVQALNVPAWNRIIRTLWIPRRSIPARMPSLASPIKLKLLSAAEQVRDDDIIIV